MVNKKIASIYVEHATLHICGYLDFATVMQVWEKSLEYLSTHTSWRMDFSEVQSSNSVVVSLILEWLKKAKRQHKPIQLLHLPKQVLAIAHVSSLDKLLQNIS